MLEQIKILVFHFFLMFSGSLLVLPVSEAIIFASITTLLVAIIGNMR